MIEGYKDSTLGKIPQNWDVVTVKEITKEHKQGFYTKDGYIKNGIRLARITDLNNPKVNFSEMPMLNISDSDYQSYKIEKGDFLFARSGAIGRYGIVENEEHPAVFASYLIRFRFNADIVNRFFGYFFESYLCGNQLRGITQGNANVNINAENIKSLKFPLAPFEEQQKITEILSTVDDKIEVIDQQIIETKELKKGLMQRLLTRGIGHTEFKDSPLGEIPKSWEVEKLGKLATSFAGGTPKRGVEGYYGGSIPWIKSGEVNNNSIEGAEEHVTELALKESSAKLIEANSILVAMYGATAGKVGVLKISACSNQAVLAISSKVSTITNLFLYHYLKKSTIELLNLCQGSGQPNLSKGIVDSLQIPLPPIPEQQKIAQILNSVDDKLEILSEKKTHYQELKQGLMQQLLTGKIRVNV